LAALVIFSLPIIDTAVAIIRRKVAGKSISEPDSNHIHHKLLRKFLGMGLGKRTSVKVSVLLMYGLSGIFMIIGYGMIILNSMRLGLTIFACLFAVIGAVIYKSETAEPEKPTAEDKSQ